MLTLTKKHTVCMAFMSLCIFFSAACTKAKNNKIKTTSQSIGKSQQHGIEQKQKKTIDVVAAKLQKKQIFDPREFGGRLKSKNESPLIALRAGLISHSYKRAGEQVRKGQAVLAVSPVDGVGMKPTVIRAPLSGVVSQLSYLKGSLVEKGQRIGVVSEKDAFESTVYVTDADLASFDVGDQVDLEVQARGLERKAGKKLVRKNEKKIILAKVLSKALKPEPNSTGYAVRLALGCAQGVCKGLRLGSFVKMILKENFRDGFRLPLNVLQSNQTKVLLVDREQKARWRGIELGSAFGDEVEITSGLEEPYQKGWLLVTGRSKKPKEGDSLNVTTKENSLKEVLESPISKSVNDVKPSKG